MKRFIGRACIGLLLTAIAGCAGADPLSPRLDAVVEHDGTTMAVHADASNGKTPDSVSVLPGEGANLDGGEFNDGQPPPEIAIKKRDGTTLRPGH